MKECSSGGSIECPHCHRRGKGLVMETRRDENGVYRRRGCGHCGKTFVTLETAPAGLRMPAKFSSRKRKEAGGDRDVPSRGDDLRRGARGDVKVTSGALFSAWHG